MVRLHTGSGVAGRHPCPRMRTRDRLRLPRWFSRDPLVFAVGAVALVTYALHGLNGVLTRDLAVYSYAGQQVADGVPPYMGILNRAGPLGHVIPAIGVAIARLGGFDDVTTMRVLFLLIATVCTCVVYLLGRDVFRSRPAGLVTAATFLTFYGFIHYAANGPREKTPMTLFIVCALWAVARKRWFTAGLFVSLATLCLQIAFFTAFPAVLAGVILTAHEGRVRALARVALGGAVPVVLFGLWFALAGSLRASIDAFVVINWTYTVPNPVMEDLDDVWLGLQDAYGMTVWLLVGGVVALALRSLVVVWPKARHEDPAVDVLAAFTVGALTGVAWNLKDYDSWPDLFPLLPLAAVGVGGLFALVFRRLSTRPAFAMALVLSVAATVVAVHYSVTTRNHTLETQRKAVDSVLKQFPPGASITSIQAPQPLVLTGRTNPTRWQMFSAGLQIYLEDTWPGGRDAFRRALVDEHPDLIAVGDTVSKRWRREIAPDYVYVGSAPDWGWYAPASLGEAKLADLRRAAGYDPTDEFADLETPSG